MNAVMFACLLVRMRVLKLRLATKSQFLCLCLFTPPSRHVFAAMPPNDWKNEAMWLQGHIDDWFDRSGRTIVKLPEKGRDPPTIFLTTSLFSPISLSRFAICSTGGDCYRTTHGITFLYLHDNRHNIERLFPMTERFGNEWSDKMVPVPDLYCVTKEKRLPPCVRGCDYFGRPV